MRHLFAGEQQELSDSQVCHTFWSQSNTRQGYKANWQGLQQPSFVPLACFLSLSCFLSLTKKHSLLAGAEQQPIAVVTARVHDVGKCQRYAQASGKTALVM